MEVHDLIVWYDDMFGVTRTWEVKSVCLGSVHTESLIELWSLTEAAGTDTAGKQHRTTWVPEPLLRNLDIYRRVQNRQLGERAFQRIAHDNGERRDQ